MHHRLASAALVLAACSAATAQSPTPAASAPTPAAGAGLTDKLINDPAGPNWAVYGNNQRSRVLPTGGPKNYPALQVTIVVKGTNAWDVGASSQLTKPVAVGDVVLVAAWLRAPQLKDGETTPVPYFGVNENAAPFAKVADGSAKLTNQWKVFYASGRAPKALTPGTMVMGLHLAAEKHVVEIGPVRVFDLGPNADMARLPANAG